MTLQQLIFVVEAAKYQSINKAAKKLHISQPNVSTAILNLEQELGIKIFVRTKNGVDLTDEGAEFAAHARRVLEQYDEIQSVYTARKNNASIIKVTSNRLTYVNLSLINYYKKHAQNKKMLSVYVRQTHSQDVHKDLLNGNSSIGIVAYPKNSIESWIHLFKSNSIDWKFLYWTEETVFLRKGHPLLSKESISFEDLKAYPLIQSISSSRELPNLNVEIQFLRYKEFPQVIYVSERSSLYEFLYHTDAIYFSLVSTHVTTLYPEIVVLPLPRFMPGITWGHFLLKEKNREWSRDEEDFIECLYEVIQSAEPDPAAHEWVDPKSSVSQGV